MELANSAKTSPLPPTHPPRDPYGAASVSHRTCVHSVMAHEPHRSPPPPIEDILSPPRAMQFALPDLPFTSNPPPF